MKLQTIVSIATLTLLAACVHPNLSQQNDWKPAENVNDFTADGRLAVKVEEKGSYANFDWSYQNQVQTISVNTPLGSTVGQLCKDNQGVLAVDNKGRVYQAETAEELSNKLLGYELPVQYLHIWADGKRVANAPYRLLPDGRLEQFDWTITRSTNTEGKPKILQLENAKLNVRLVFDEVNHEPAASDQTQCAARLKK